MTRAEKAAMPRPLKLRALLARLGIKHEDIVPHIVQANGRPLSRTAFSHWLNQGKALVHTPMEDIKQQVITYLRDEHVSEADIGSAFEPEEENRIYAVSRTTAPTTPAPREPEIKPVEKAVLTPAARERFGLAKNPFPSDMSEIDSDADVMLWPNNRFILASMQSAARTGGLLAIIAESGAGKSVIRKKFLEDARANVDQLRVIYPRTIDKARITASALCETLIRDLMPGRPIPLSLESRGDLAEKALRKLFATGSRACMYIEEAHDLTEATMKYMKRFWEIDVGWKRPLAFLLMGQTELKRKLNEVENPQLREFIRRCEVAEMTPLDDLVEKYLQFKCDRAGVQYRAVFAPDAAQAIHDRLTIATRDGKRSLCYPLVINNLVVNALNDAAKAGFDKVDASVIAETRRV